MAEESKKLVVEIDAQTYSLIEEYSRYMNQENKKVVNYLLNQSLKEFVTNYQNLKKGYVDMASINLEISDAFTVSENEAFNCIDYEE
jgi:hypothetical protein